MSLSKSDEHVRQIPVRPEHVENTQFPDGLRVLAIDDNEVCLRWLQALLEKCRYKVTASTNTIEALAMLRQNKDNFDIVITNVNKFDMDGFLLLDIIGLEMDIPVIMISADDSKSTVMKGIRHGARDYLLKPVRLEEIKNIWQHVVRKSLSDPNKSCLTKGVTDQDPMCLKRNRDSGKEKQDESNTHSNCDSCPPNKKRVYWTKGLHNKFVDAIEQLGENAVPKEILRIMNEPGMRRENVASHLQKFRKMLKKKNGKVKQEINNDVGPDNKGGHLPNTTILSFGNQGHDATSRHDRAGVHANSNAEMTRLGDGTIKSEPFDTSRMDLKSFFQPPNQQNMFLQHYPPAPQLVNQMTHLGDGTIKSEQFDTSHMDLKSFFQPPNQQNKFLQHYPPAPQLVNQMQPRMHIPVHGNTLQTPLWTGNPPPVPEFNGLKFQTFSSGPKVLNDIMDVPSCFPSYSDGSKPGSSSNPFVLYPPNSYSSGRMFFDYPHQMLGGASTAMTAIPQQNSAVMPVQNSLMGQHGGRNIVDRNGRGNLDLRVQINGSPSGIQGPIIQDSNGNGQINSFQQSQDNSQAGGNSHHNSPICSEDDLSAMVKQFGDDRAPML